MVSRVTRSQENRRTMKTALVALTEAADCSRCPTAVEVVGAVGAVAVAVCTRRSPEIWTDPCRWVSWAVACPGRRRQWSVAGSAVVVPWTRMGGARTSWATVWSSGAWTPSRGSTWARTADSELESSESRAVSSVSSESPAQNGRDQKKNLWQGKIYRYFLHGGVG